MIEFSHFLGSIAGIVLILLAHSLQRRVETAYYAVVLLLTGGIVFSLLKGFDYEEAVILAVTLGIILPCRRHFYRKGALLTARFSAGWFAAILLVIACTSIDLMRYATGAPHNVMEFLFIQLMLWGKEQGYEWFDLSMAPLSGVDAKPLGPMWNRIAALAYRHSEHFYNFQGLREYKDKFDPVWTPKYLASPGGLALPVILTNVATLISGGVTRLVSK